MQINLFTIKMCFISYSLDISADMLFVEIIFKELMYFFGGLLTQLMIL